MAGDGAVTVSVTDIGATYWILFKYANYELKCRLFVIQEKLDCDCYKHSTSLVHQKMCMLQH